MKCKPYVLFLIYNYSCFYKLRFQPRKRVEKVMAQIIMIDGMSGSGKGTIAAKVYEYLERCNKEGMSDKKPSAIAEPTNFLGDVIRHYRRLPRERRSPLTELHLFLADRHQLVHDVLRPRKDEPVIFVSDRGFPSTCVYQQSAEIPLETILQLHDFYPMPDLTLLFVCEPKTAMQRILGRAAETGKAPTPDENPETLTLYKSRFEALQGRLPNAHLVYTEGSASAVAWQVQCHVNNLLQIDMHKAVFLDKDGTLVDNTDAEHVIPTDRIYAEHTIDGLRRLQAAGYKLVLVSNQPWIARGRMTGEETEEVFQSVTRQYATHGIRIDAYYYCSHESGTGCACKKPQTLLLEEAASKFNINTTESYMVGDREKDIQAGRNFGLKTCLVQTGDGKKYMAGTKADYVLADVNAFAAEILEK